MPIRHRTLRERLELYSRVRDLTSQGDEPKAVAAKMGISIDDVRYWLRVKQPSREVYVPDLSPGPDLAYLVGAYLGDGRTAGEQDKKVRFNVADPDFAELLNELLAKILRTSSKAVKMEYGFYSVSYDAAVLYDYLQQPLTDQLPLIESVPAMFLRGFFDAEGYVSHCWTIRKGDSWA
jgi:intein-encoded DNA endonuclease-like protein